MRQPVFLAYDLSTLQTHKEKQQLFNFFLIDAKGNDLLYRKSTPLIKLDEVLKRTLHNRIEIVIWDDELHLLPFHGYTLRDKFIRIMPTKNPADLSSVQMALFMTQLYLNEDRDQSMKIFHSDWIATFLRHEATGLKRLYEIYRALR